MSSSPEQPHSQGESSEPQQSIDLRKDGSASRMRSHKGNVPVLPQTKLCPHCPAKFTRTTHLNRHLRTHTNERVHVCDECGAKFTRSDLLTRHKRGCGDTKPPPPPRTRRRSCKPCADSKIKCDLQRPCSKCQSRGKQCEYATDGRTAREILEASKKEEDENAPNDSAAEADVGKIDDVFLPPADGRPKSSSAPNTTTLDPSLFDGIEGLNLESIASQSNFGTSATGSDYTTDVTSSHLSSQYQNDMFQPLFNSLFAINEEDLAMPDAGTSSGSDQDKTASEEQDTPPGHDEFPFAPEPMDVQPITASVEDEAFYQQFVDRQEAPATAPAPVNKPAVHLPPISAFVWSCPMPDATHPDCPDASVEELNHYTYLFYTAFLAQMPVIHHALDFSKKTPMLRGAMQACGALFVKTKRARIFVKRRMHAAQDELIPAFGSNPTDDSIQYQLIMATTLLQTIGLFHQRPEQRANSTVYHGMLVQLIRRAGLFRKYAAWRPSNLDETPLHDQWIQWTVYETKKRMILLSYIHDACHAIYFNLPPSYQVSELVMNLPCEDALWNAGTAEQWLEVLRRPSPYGSTVESRLLGVSFQASYHMICSHTLLGTPVALSPYAHFILIHAVLSKLCVACAGATAASEAAVGRTIDPAAETARREDTVARLQFCMHNWLQSWLSSPDLPRTSAREEEPNFLANALPFYWFGQVALLAFQEGIPPFDSPIANDSAIEKRFKLVKQWLKHIRMFLKSTDQAPTLFWDELMKIRLQSAQLEENGGPHDDQEGLVAFFPGATG